jgi:hypothetical protein
MKTLEPLSCSSRECPGKEKKTTLARTQLCNTCRFNLFRPLLDLGRLYPRGYQTKKDQEYLVGLSLKTCLTFGPERCGLKIFFKAENNVYRFKDGITVEKDRTVC